MGEGGEASLRQLFLSPINKRPGSRNLLCLPTNLRGTSEATWNHHVRIQQCCWKFGESWSCASALDPYALVRPAGVNKSITARDFALQLVDPKTGAKVYCACDREPGPVQGDFARLRAFRKPPPHLPSLDELVMQLACTSVEAPGSPSVPVSQVSQASYSKDKAYSKTLMEGVITAVKQHRQLHHFDIPDRCGLDVPSAGSAAPKRAKHEQ